MYYMVLAGDEVEYQICHTLKEARKCAKGVAERDTFEHAVIYKYVKNRESYPVESVYAEKKKRRKG